MSELVQMRHRIKAVETIKKITHAMCLISMSTNAFLKGRLHGLNDYIEALKKLHTRALELSNMEHSNHENKSQSQVVTRELIIIIGAQKGLCGSFSNQLFAYLHANHPQHTLAPHDVIIIGKKATEMIALTILRPIKAFDNLTQSTYENIAQEICNLIFKNTTTEKVNQSCYKTITIISMRSITFFTHKGTTTKLTVQEPSDTGPNDLEEYDSQEDDIQAELEKNLISATISTSLLTSMIAEQAARFIAMDGSTRNASNLLDAMKLDYNKLRQARITRELTDLAGSF